MKMLISETELNNSKYNIKIPFECKICKKTFYIIKKYVNYIKKHPSYRPIDYCSIKCSGVSSQINTTYYCKQCNNSFIRTPSQNTKSKHLFCNNSCAAKYNNTHKTKGTRRSKLEVWLETKLTEKYPNLPIEYNKTTAINSELDIYIPSLKLAFELNGIFHYEPIYGDEKLYKTQTNDTHKFSTCLKNSIGLCVIDTHNVKYLKKERDKKFLDIITNIIDEKVK
jgi:DNA-binding XRE family transcriptional regulator